MSINNHPMQRKRNPFHRPDGWKSMSIGNGVFLQADFRGCSQHSFDSARVVKRHRTGAICMSPKEHYGNVNLSQFGRDMYALRSVEESNSIY